MLSRTHQADPALGVTARDVVTRALRTAGPEVRATLMLVAAGYQHREIADRLNISERGLEGRLHRFRKQIRNAPLAQDLLEVLRERATVHSARP
ncbi:hypothetical protein AB0B50_44365 [Streptomyces sp. NPDC041068]|uniref:hypothetical protein n=1 Tax=Streptomyces sp. NPDC041068 TaxID=3155130 RepID=UPI0033D79066